ncbi:hypothetical protein [Olivibacter domesticus]|uniref:Uncharacterized protein n=1 Tax=Olivibacter domesticus TaxID=407022 RepID=A0A1H7IFU4_OLID1|nr:hypothetical protein [Olivibacter domesticus]SEK61194.1 hypothetical protein SAMN05661044_00684 [Olivibacter domesticus]
MNKKKLKQWAIFKFLLANEGSSVGKYRQTNNRDLQSSIWE